MKDVLKKLKVIAFIVVLATTITNVATPMVMAEIYDISEEEYTFSGTYDPDEQERVKVYPYISGGSTNLYIRFRNPDDAEWMIDVFDLDTHDRVIKTYESDYRIPVYVEDLDPDHSYRVIIRNVSDFSARIRDGRIF